MKLTRAVTHIRLCDANDAKVAALNALAAEYIVLCQQYVTHFCVEAEPDGYADPSFSSLLSQRWQRVAIQQAAGIARSWRTNHQNAAGAQGAPGGAPSALAARNRLVVVQPPAQLPVQRA